jgi:hypothetical protein
MENSVAIEFQFCENGLSTWVCNNAIMNSVTIMCLFKLSDSFCVPMSRGTAAGGGVIFR